MIIGSDHAAFELKEKIGKHLVHLGIDVKDVGTNGESSVNYVDFGKKVAKAVAEKEFDRGILLCGTGIGMSMVANRFTGVRAALCNDLFSARLSRRHNNANILVLGARVIGDMLAYEIVREWLETGFEGGRHSDRIDSIDAAYINA
ncbi:MAG: ribose 5-phosphate isomerase B [Desulfarculaceae bacterium]|nr:ribose 5-phosphate isomerase B [Desulfarculaceae bacterium]